MIGTAKEVKEFAFGGARVGDLVLIWARSFSHVATPCILLKDEKIGFESGLALGLDGELHAISYSTRIQVVSRCDEAQG